MQKTTTTPKPKNSKQGKRNAADDTAQQIHQAVLFMHEQDLADMSFHELQDDFKNVYEKPEEVHMHLDQLSEAAFSSTHTDDWPALKRGSLLAFVNDVRRLITRMYPADPLLIHHGN